MCAHETHTHRGANISIAKPPRFSSVSNSALQGGICADSEKMMKVIEL